MEVYAVFTSTGLVSVALPSCKQWIIVTNVNRVPKQIALKRLFQRLYAHTESEILIIRRQMSKRLGGHPVSVTIRR